MRLYRPKFIDFLNNILMKDDEQFHENVRRKRT